MLQSDVRVLEVEPYFLAGKARTPLKFGSVIVEESTFLHVRARVETRSGRVADGWGAIFLSDMWSWPSKIVPHEQRDEAMRAVATDFCALVADTPEYHHPIDLWMSLEDDLHRTVRTVGERMCLAEEMPRLCGLNAVSSIDAAVHDAFAIANGIGVYDGYSAEFMPYDLSTHLGPAFAGRYPADFLQPRYRPEVPVFHLVGGLDKLRRSEIEASDPRDGIPVSLDAWVERDGLTCLKIKLLGTDLAWDIERTIEVVRVAQEVHRRLGTGKADDLQVSMDTNEQCPDPQYVLDYLHTLQERAPAAYRVLLYVEQPTERDLQAHRWDMREVAALKPAIIDESLTGPADYDLARELGWSGVGLKTCKGQSGALLVLCRAIAEGVPYTIQDLTNPGLSLIHAVGFAARCNALNGVEANVHQFFPALSVPEETVHPRIFQRRDGVLKTDTLGDTGFGYRVDEIDRPIFRAGHSGS